MEAKRLVDLGTASFYCGVTIEEGVSYSTAVSLARAQASYRNTGGPTSLCPAASERDTGAAEIQPRTHGHWPGT